MKIISISLLLIVSQEVSHCLSHNKSLRQTGCRSSEILITVEKIGFCLQYKRLGQECLIKEQCNQIENSICFGGKQIESLTENQIMDYYRGVSSVCQCENGYKQIGPKCFTSRIKNLYCTSNLIPSFTDVSYDPCKMNAFYSHCDYKTNECHCDSYYYFDSKENGCRLLLSIIDERSHERCAQHSDCLDWEPNSVCNYHRCYCNSSHYFDYLADIGAQCKPFEEIYGKNNKQRTPYWKWMTISGGVVFFFIAIKLSFCKSLKRRSRLTSDAHLSVLENEARVDFDASERLNQLGTSSSLIRNINQSNQLIVSLPFSTVDNPYSLIEDLPPPYKEELPTYEEAMAVNAVNAVNALLKS